MIAVGTRLVVFGGLGYDGVMNDLYVFHTTNSTWVK
jgi:hypothetical protein